MGLDLDGLERDAYERGQRDATLECVAEIAKITGPMEIGNFNEKTWKMLCAINARLLEMAADAASRCD